MIMPSDKDYQETKQIMLGKKTMKPEFKALAEWIDQTYGVRTINIYYDTIDQGTRPRIEICFEYAHEKAVFEGSNRFNYDPEKQKAIAQKFEESLKAQDLVQENKSCDFFKPSAKTKYKTKNVWVTFGAFESIALIDANESIPKEKIKALIKALNNPALWEISKLFSVATFFLYTDQQVKQYKNSASHKEWTDKYFELLSQYDEFQYFDRAAYGIYLDSKENFDKNYDSNWYYYYK